MKYAFKCVSCHRKATFKYRGRYFCNDCLKRCRRNKKCKSIMTDIHVATIAPDVRIYGWCPIKLK